MTDFNASDPDVTRAIRSWLHEDRHEDASRIAAAVLDRVEATPRRRPSWWPARRTPNVNKILGFAGAAAAVGVAVLLGARLLGSPAPSGPGAAPTPSPSPSVAPAPTPQPTASLVTHALTTFEPVGIDGEEDPRAASITFTFDAPASWERFGELGVWIDDNEPPDGANLFFYRGGGLFSEPCLTDAEAGADIPVGPTVDDLVTALVDHPSLDVTSPVDVTLAGYSGTYLDLLIPDDISACAAYQPMDGHHYAQGPGHRWHMWILDVDGVRVLVETNDYAGTSAERLAEEQAMIDSLEITP